MKSLSSMAEDHLTLIKLNRFVIFYSTQLSSSPSPSPSPNNIFTKIIEWLMAIPNLFISLFHRLQQAFTFTLSPQAKTILLIIAAVIIVGVFIFCCLPLAINLIGTVFTVLWVTCCYVATGLAVTCMWVAEGVGVTCMWVGITCRACLMSCCVPVTGAIMMRAPGTAYVISRALFAGATRAYFVALRAGTLVVCCGRVVGFPGA